MREKKMSNELQSLRKLDQIQRLYLTLLCFAASVLATALVVVHNNSTRSSSIFIFLLFFGIGVMLALGLVRGVLVSLLLISAWIATKQLLGVWEEIRLLDNLLELILTGLTFILSGLYHDRLQLIMKVYRENQNKLKQLDFEDKTVGLIKPAIGLLRLVEEEDRSIRYRRPFALVLLIVQPIPGIDLEPKEMTELTRAVATSIKDTTRDTDIPFLAGNNKIAIILPETETSGANKVLNNIFNRMNTTQFVTQSGNSMLIQKRIQLRFGFAVFLGASNTKINMMEAAERSLQLCLETNIGDLFQNIFVEWTIVGEKALSTPLFEKAVF
jgi:GGDEF domain-containing protein